LCDWYTSLHRQKPTIPCAGLVIYIFFNLHRTIRRRIRAESCVHGSCFCDSRANGHKVTIALQIEDIDYSSIMGKRLVTSRDVIFGVRFGLIDMVDYRHVHYSIPFNTLCTINYSICVTSHYLVQLGTEINSIRGRLSCSRTLHNDT
jgi:hypothetical protein